MKKRLTRSEFWLRYAAAIIVCAFLEVPAFGIMLELDDSRTLLKMLVLVIPNLVCSIFLYIIGLQRFHDAGLSTTMYVICFCLQIILIGSFLLLYYWVKPSDGPNTYGMNKDLEKLMRDREKTTMG